jgi:hypothetical protein
MSSLLDATKFDRLQHSLIGEELLVRLAGYELSVPKCAS